MLGQVLREKEATLGLKNFLSFFLWKVILSLTKEIEIMIPVCSIYLCFAETELSCQSESKEALGNGYVCISKLLSLGTTDSVKMIPQISTVSSTVNTLPSHNLCWEPTVCRSREYEGGATNARNGLCFLRAQPSHTDTSCRKATWLPTEKTGI